MTKLCSEKKTLRGNWALLEENLYGKNAYKKKLQNSLKGHGFVSGTVNLKYPGFRILVQEKKSRHPGFQIPVLKDHTGIESPYNTENFPGASRPSKTLKCVLIVTEK